MISFQIKKLEEEAKNESGDRLDEINLEKGRLRKKNPKPHPLFKKFFEAFVEKKTEEVNDLLELVEAYYKPKLSEV